MCRLPDTTQGRERTPLDLRSHPSLAHEVVAGLQDLSKGTASLPGPGKGRDVKAGAAHTIDRTVMRRPKPVGVRPIRLGRLRPLNG
jgi:hypothetical protein